jgi:hypothetical protein
MLRRSYVSAPIPLIRTVLRPAPSRRSTRASAALRHRAAALVALAAAAALAACGGRDPFARDPRNNVDTQQTDFRLYSLSRASGPLASAVNLYTLTVLRPGLTVVQGSGGAVSAPNFDFAVDLAADGRVRLLPSKLVVDLTGVGQVFQTGFQLPGVPFDSVGEAPTSGYAADSALTVGVGQAVIVQAQSSVCPTYYAKAVVLAVDPATGAVSMRARLNPNCGFRALRPGRG